MIGTPQERPNAADEGGAMTVRTPAPPPLPDELDQLLRRLRLPYIRRAAPEMVATAKAQLHPAGFDELIPKTLAAATVDRLLHHAHVLVTDGVESYRLAQATAGKGAMPLA